MRDQPKHERDETEPFMQQTITVPQARAHHVAPDMARPVLAVGVRGNLDLDRAVPGRRQPRRAAAHAGKQAVAAFDFDLATVTPRSSAQMQRTHARREGGERSAEQTGKQRFHKTSATIGTHLSMLPAMVHPPTIPGYRILRALGQGGMATVCLAIQESLGREVALKLLSPPLAADPIATERFLREGRVAAKLAHRHIVGIHDVGVHEGQPYLSMEYMPGGVVATTTALAPAEALEIVRQVALALDHAHAQGVVHRDIKPENILRRIDGSYALGDFGIARAANADSALTQEGLAIGTPYYMSPEQIQGLPLDGRSDLYSLGVVLHQLLTGHLPYVGTADVAVGIQHVHAPLPKLPAPFAACQSLLDLLLAKRPQDRLSDAAELARRAEALQEVGGLAATALTPRTPAPAATARTPIELRESRLSAGKEAAPAGRSIRLPVIAAAAAIAVLVGIGAWRAWYAAADATTAAGTAVAAQDRSIAVLPLLNASGDESQQFFADGLSENLIVALSQFDGLRVISRNSSFQFREGNEDSRAIGAKLGVAHLLEGSVQHAGDTVRVVAALVRSADGSTIWSQRYDRPYDDLFALQDELTAAVAAALKAKLLPTTDAHPLGDRPPSGNLEAYAALLRGRFHADRRTEADQRKAIEELSRATLLDPGYAEAWATLSRTWTGLTALALSGDAAQKAYTEARSAVETAIALAPDLAAAHAARGYLLANADYDWQGAEAEYRRAIALAPADDNAKSGLGRVVAAQGRVREAVDLTRQVLANDPLYASQHYWQSIYLGALGRLDEARASVHRAIELQSQAGTFHLQATTVEIARGDPAAALAAAMAAPPGIWRDVALALARAAGRDRAASDAAMQVVVDQHAAFAAYQIAGVYALRGDPDRAFEWLDRALANRDPGITFLLYDPLLLTLRQDPRLAMFCHKVGLPPPERSEALGLGGKS